MRSVTSYYWPSKKDGGLLRKIHSIQHPNDCLSPNTKFLVWQAMVNPEKDTRGLTAWAHAASSHLLHALNDGDQFDMFGPRVLINDDRLWPMARGCIHGPETREVSLLLPKGSYTVIFFLLKNVIFCHPNLQCYFEPLTNCTISHVDADGSNNALSLKLNGDEYNRQTRTVYLTRTDPWFRVIRDKYSFTGLQGNSQDHSEIEITAAAIAYYLQPKKWLVKEIDRRLRESIPPDLDPMRTAGIPIRRSDKCHGHNLAGSAAGELDCPPLEKYLDGLHSLLQFDPLIENVIVTSEEKAVCQEFIVMLKEEYPKLRVVQNVGDVQQGTGSGTMVEAYVEGAVNADVVASALTSLHLHLRARYFVITSKSTWTSTIAGKVMF
jgi:hypothetical protein